MLLANHASNDGEARWMDQLGWNVVDQLDRHELLDPEDLSLGQDCGTAERGDTSRQMTWCRWCRPRLCTTCLVWVSMPISPLLRVTWKYLFGKWYAVCRGSTASVRSTVVMKRLGAGCLASLMWAGSTLLGACTATLRVGGSTCWYASLGAFRGARSAILLRGMLLASTASDTRIEKYKY